MIRSLQHVAITLPDPQQAARFYTAFGLEVADAGAGIAARCFGRTQDQIVVAESARRGLGHVSFGIRPADLASTRRTLEACGTRLLDPPYPGSPDGLWFRDLDGNLIHLGTETPAPPRRAYPSAVNTSSWCLRRAERGCPPSGLEPKPLRLGHLILFSPDPAKQAAFYREVLGMKLSDRVGDNLVVFLRGAFNGDHHLLGFLREPNPGLHHVSFEMESLDHIELAAGRLRDAGYRHVWGTGRHVVGSNLFHYFRDPWGTLAEYFYDMDFIPEDATWQPRTWSKEQGLFLWSHDGPPPPDFPCNLAVEA